MDSIKRTRKARGLSLTQVAIRSGLHRVAVAQAEREGTDPRGSTIAKIAKALKVPVCELFEESGHERRRPKRRPRR